MFLIIIGFAMIVLGLINTLSNYVLTRNFTDIEIRTINTEGKIIKVEFMPSSDYKSRFERK
jgi:hypothetical protein